MAVKKQDNELLEKQDTFNKEFRPKSLGDVIGQDSVVEVLLNSLLYNEIPNSLILQGPKGTGKTSTARAFAKTLNCKEIQNTLEPFIKRIKENPNADISLEELKDKIKPCNECDTCKSFNLEPEYAGVIELDAGSEGKVDEVRNLKEKVRYTSISKYKVVIIDEAHNMSDGGKTALLKIIEEPPVNVVFIFATTHPDDLLPTIKSRSLIMKFNGVEDALIEDRLKYICNERNISIVEGGLAALASKSDGGVRDSIKNLEYLALKCKRRTIEFADIEDVVEIEPEYVRTIDDLLFNESDITKLLTSLNDIVTSRKISIEKEHLDFFMARIRERMYAAKEIKERAMLVDIYNLFISGKERFLYNVPARTVVEATVIEAFGRIETFKLESVNNISVTTGPKIAAHTSVIEEPQDIAVFNNRSATNTIQEVTPTETKTVAKNKKIAFEDYKEANDNSKISKIDVMMNLLRNAHADSLDVLDVLHLEYLEDINAIRVTGDVFFGEDIKRILSSESTQSLKTLLGLSGGFKLRLK